MPLQAFWVMQDGCLLRAIGFEASSMRKSVFYRFGYFDTMDAEHINLIGTTLTDLSARTDELRGYL